jgi:hypothetical protein
MTFNAFYINALVVGTLFSIFVMYDKEKAKMLAGIATV